MFCITQTNPILLESKKESLLNIRNKLKDSIGTTCVSKAYNMLNTQSCLWQRRTNIRQMASRKLNQLYYCLTVMLIEIGFKLRVKYMFV